MLRAGDCLLIADPADESSAHFGIVISDPSLNAQSILLVGLTTWEDYKDDSCILEPADWPELSFLRHRSCIDYRHALCASEAEIETWVKSGRAQFRGSVTPALLDRARRGAQETRFLAMKYVLLLADQGLIELKKRRASVCISPPSSAGW